MTTGVATGDAWEIIRDLVESSIGQAATNGFTVIWPNEGAEVPDATAEKEAQPFIYFDLIVTRSFIAAFGAGVGNNLWRNLGRIEAHVMIPTGTGVTPALAATKALAAIFRGYRTQNGGDGDFSCFAAAEEPGAPDEENGNYWHAQVVVDLQFDLYG